ncbi:hypothetical protein ES703_122497 [subsurface metagenome]
MEHIFRGIHLSDVEKSHIPFEQQVLQVIHDSQTLAENRHYLLSSYDILLQNQSMNDLKCVPYEDPHSQKEEVYRLKIFHPFD